MTNRLQVLFDEDEYCEIQGFARHWRMTASEWVRQELRKARTDDPGTINAELRAGVEASRHRFPIADIEVKLRELESGLRIT